MIISDENGKILRPNFGDPKIVVDRNEPYKATCMHKYLAVRPNSRRVLCRSCKAEVDPFDVLLDLTREWDWCTHFARQQEELEAKIAALKAEESNAKQRLRNVYKKAPEAKTTLYFEEFLRRLNEVQTQQDFWDIRTWQGSFQWLDAEQRATLKEAEILAKRRIEDSNRHRAKRGKRTVTVVGKDSGEE